MLGRVELKSTLARMLSTDLVNSKNGLDRSLTILFQERSRKNKMAALNEHTFVLAAILSDISDHNDTILCIYRQRANVNNK